MTEQRKGSYKYFADLGDGSDPQAVITKTAYVDDVRSAYSQLGSFRVITKNTTCAVKSDGGGQI